MKKHYTVFLALLAVNVILPVASMAAIDKPATESQIRSLKGISSINFAVAYDPDKKLINAVSSSLADVSVPVKSVDLDDDKATPLGSKNARLVVVVDDRDNDQNWVGLYVQQKSKLDRNPAISYDAETYKLGTLCPDASTEAAIKELCAQFVRDFGVKTAKKK